MKPLLALMAIAVAVMQALFLIAGLGGLHALR